MWLWVVLSYLAPALETTLGEGHGFCSSTVWVNRDSAPSLSRLVTSSPSMQNARDRRGVTSTAAFALNDLYPLRCYHKAQNGFFQLLGLHSLPRGTSKLFSYRLFRWIPALHRRMGLNGACRATCPTSVTQKLSGSLHGEPLETGVMCLLLSSRDGAWPHTCFPVPGTTSNANPLAAGLSALMPPPTTACSIGHRPRPLRDGVAWGAEVVRPLPHESCFTYGLRALSPSSHLSHTCARCGNQFRH